MAVCDWLYLDTATDGGSRYHPSGQGTKRKIGIPPATGGTAGVAAYTISNRRVTCTGAFNFTLSTGDRFIPLVGSEFVLGQAYTISSNAANFVVLTAGQAGLPAKDVSGVEGYVMPVDSVLGNVTSGVNQNCRILGVTVQTADASDAVITIADARTGLRTLPIPVPASIAVPHFIPLGDDVDGVSFPGGFYVTATGSTLAFSVYFAGGPK